MSAAEVIGVADAVELAVVERSGFVESRHSGTAIVLSPDGQVVRSLGDPEAPLFPRSCLKPFQAVAVMASGVALRGEDAAIATASHTGTAGHVALVRGLLDRANISPARLGCPPAMPSDRAAREQLIRDGNGPDRLYMNCSGKHAAMLLACVANNWPLEGYLDPRHPLQKRILDVIERLTGEKPVATGIDGCGAPVHAITLRGLAHGVQRITTSSASSPFALYREAGALTEAVRENGWVIAGPGQPDSIAIDRLGVFAKAGAEGVMIMTAPDGTSVALKVLDGSSRASAIVALRLLVSAGALDSAAVDAVAAELDLWVSGGSGRVGEIRATV
ncbi:asparaginase [Agromyces atrinae]|uniref:Asparaginase n=1 Tax=Agromyces atrinae TaxID=592376 RepID=A0A4Q2M6V8_9MICO|nr:asparaginase [Agromyces atrinae]MCI2959013.1 asparaginase [Agromyces atrinae]RXZ85552.1 asparaginase [Agromyces atrinae]